MTDQAALLKKTVEIINHAIKFLKIGLETFA